MNHSASIRNIRPQLFPLRNHPALSIETAMNTRRVMSVSSSAAFATATVRALSSTLLLLGLIGDRRAR
jgi:hypothetical protein